MTDRTEATARELIRQHGAGERYRTLEGALKPVDLDEAYAAQFRLHAIHAAERAAGGRGPLGGRKIALASKVQQELCGVDHPIAGGVFARDIHMSPATLRMADFNGPGLEFELAAKLAAPVAPGEGPFDAASILPKVASLHPAFEIIIDRHADYAKIEATTMVADNCWCAGVVLGPEIEGWRGLDVDALPCELLWNDEPPVTARAGDAGPLEKLAWVATELARRGQGLQAGDVVITGSVIRTRAPKAGDRVRYRIAGREVSLTMV